MILHRSIITLLFFVFCSQALAEVSPKKTLTVNGDNVYVKAYSYSPHGGVHKHHPIFKFSDLVNRARLYKIDNPSEQVIVNVAIYKVAEQVYVGNKDDGSGHYGWVGGYDFGGSSTEKFLWTLRQARAADVEIRFIYHNPNKNDPDDDGGVEDYLDGGPGTTNPATKMVKNTDFKRVRWWCAYSQVCQSKNSGNYSDRSQMHNKFVTVNKAKGDTENSVLTDVVYTSTSNIDEFESGTKVPKVKLAQAGVMVYSHPPLYQAYNQYFEMLWADAGDDNNIGVRNDLTAFKNTANSPNYDDGVFSAYFFPIEGGDDAWDVSNNPLAMMTEEIKTDALNSSWSSTNYIKINAYTANTSSPPDDFAEKFNTTIRALKCDSSASNVHVRSVVRKEGAGSCPTGSGGCDAGLIDCPAIDEFDGRKYGSNDAQTHSKTYTFTASDGSSSGKDYYSIIGSANFKHSEFDAKANNLLMIREATNPSNSIYNVFKQLFYNPYDQENNSLP